MTPAEIKKTRLYRTMAPCVRKEDREELARMLAMVPDRAMWHGLDAYQLYKAFCWKRTPQGCLYWSTLSVSLERSGHRCW